MNMTKSRGFVLALCFAAGGPAPGSLWAMSDHCDEMRHEEAGVFLQCKIVELELNLTKQRDLETVGEARLCFSRSSLMVREEAVPCLDDKGDWIPHEGDSVFLEGGLRFVDLAVTRYTKHARGGSESYFTAYASQKDLAKEGYKIVQYDGPMQYAVVSSALPDGASKQEVEKAALHRRELMSLILRINAGDLSRRKAALRAAVEKLEAQLPALKRALEDIDRGLFLFD